MILLIDNYDSFTYNLFQQIGEFNGDIVVARNDCISIAEIEEMNPEAIIISPGPGRPENAGQCLNIIQHFYASIPILGICLGHQAIAVAFGGVVTAAKAIMHGKMSSITHSGEGVFIELPQPLEVMRYHSLAVEKDALPACFEIGATTKDGEIMAIKHKEYLVVGIQFHPESIGTKQGNVLIENFLRSVNESSLQTT